jgi:hypothetical protein
MAVTLDLREYSNCTLLYDSCPDAARLSSNEWNPSLLTGAWHATSELVTWCAAIRDQVEPSTKEPPTAHAKLPGTGKPVVDRLSVTPPEVGVIAFKIPVETAVTFTSLAMRTCSGSLKSAELIDTATEALPGTKAGRTTEAV